MGWQNLSSSLRLWDASSKAVSEVEAAAEELLASGNDAETLQIFSEALDPSLERGSDFLKKLAKTEGAKCRCDAVWYGDTIAYGCKTCGLSSASCICVFCFDAGDHEGHDFYISRSDYGCCDCGDAYAWRQSGFCRHHPGPRAEMDPSQLLPEATRRRAQLFLPAQVRRLVNFHPTVLPGVPPPPMPSTEWRHRRRVKGGSGDVGYPAPMSCSDQSTEVDADGAQKVLITGINLRVTEEQLKEFLDSKLGGAQASSASALSFVLERDQETKASKGRAYLTAHSQASASALANLSGEVLRGSPIRVHLGAAVAVAEKHLQALETNFEWLLSLGGFHDGLRKIIGQVFLDRNLLGEAQSAVEVLLRHSHLMEPSVRKLETNLMVDLMLDLDFKHCFAKVFTGLYKELVQNREGNQDTNELGDFTCQIFTRQDVTLELVREKNLLKTLLDCLWDLLRPTLLTTQPAVFNHESNIFRDHEIIQCSMDLLYVLDHAEVVHEIVRSPSLRGELWAGWIRILISMQAMNPHKRRCGNHVEFTNPSWGNALTLHTDLMSNTWLILDAIESKADVEAVWEMARVGWRELRSWMVQVHVAEGRVGASSMENIDYEVANGTSFHLPVNRVLALLIHQLCLRTPRSAECSVLDQAFRGVGMAESDVHWWMEHSLRALVLQSQVMAGMWRRNGEALEHESEFYRMNYWHHLLIDADLLVLRLSALVVRPEAFFRTSLKRFELAGWLQPGDPLARLFSPQNEDDALAEPYGMQKLQSFVLFLYQLLSSHTPLSLTWPELVTHTTRQFLGVGPKSHSQLWDPRLERSTATAMAKDQQTLEAAVREISYFLEADGSGHAPAKYRLREAQWFRVDPYFHLFSWSEQQKVEENLTSALKARGHDFATWVEESVPQKPKVRDAYREAFFRWSSCGMVQAFCWLLLVRIAFQPTKKETVQPDGRLLVLALLLTFRATVISGDSDLSQEQCGVPDSNMEVDLPTDQVQIFWLAQAMGPHLSVSAKRKFSIRVESSTGQEEMITVSLMDAVERLAMPKESVFGSLARALRKRLLEQQHQPAKVHTAEEGGSSSMDVTAAPNCTDHEEDRKAKRRKAAQERQQRMLDNLRKRQDAFISGAVQKYEEETPAHSPETEASSNPVDSDQGTVAECVVCKSMMSHQEENPDPLGLICFLRPAVASSVPRQRVPTEQAVLLHQQRNPFGDGFTARPQCFDQNAPDGLVLARACSHRMHFSCWSRFSQTALNANGGRLSCPYCGTVANALLPVGPSQQSRCQGSVSQIPAAPTDYPAPRQHAEASYDFLACLEGQLSRLGDTHKQPAELAEAIGLGSALSHPLMSLSKLCADNIALAEVRARTRRAADAVSVIAQAPNAPATSSSNPAKRPLDGTVTSAAHASVLQGIVDEALDVVPPFHTIQALAFNEDTGGKLAHCLLTASPHGRFQVLVALLLGLSKGKPKLNAAGRRLLHAFYLLEALIVLTALSDAAFIDSQIRPTPEEGAPAFSTLWDWVGFFVEGSQAGLSPIHSLEEATDVLKLALNPFLYKVRLLLFLIAPEEFPSGKSLFTSANLEVLAPPEDHVRLANAEYGLPEVEELLMLRPHNNVEIAALTQLLGRGPAVGKLVRGQQPASPLLLVLVGDPVVEVPLHVWQTSQLGFDRLHASGCQEFVQLSSHSLPNGCAGRLYCAAYRLSLPVIAGTIYQKFYTQFVHARCTVCKTSSSIPTLCLLCGTFLCCNSECCRREVDGQVLGEVTQHAQVCGFGTCVFLQLSNSLVHIVADGFITCWGSLYLDGHGEEEYNLSRPLHISEVRLQQLTQMVREVSFDFESRLKWKKVILV